VTPTPSLGNILSGKVAFITGSTRGIGWATARTFAEAGASVVLNGCANADALEQRRAEIERDFGVPCVGLLADASDVASVKNCYSQIFSRFKRLDVLVNNAGVLQEGLLGMIPETAVRRSLEVNVLGAVMHIQEACRLMARNKSGSIINMSSIMGRNGAEGLSVYCATKAALLGLTLSAAKELAPKNIRVNAVAPGFIDTDMSRVLPEALYAKRLASVKMGRAGTPEEVAQTVLFLASDLSRYVTGQVLGVDGGMLI
jgi:3-oxoacyl-[acyl-carrier protein] reductase